MLVALVASVHYLALGLGMGSVFMRGRYIGALKTAAAVERAPTLKALFAADNIWGVAALLWLVTGTARAFGGLEKGTAYYLGNPLFAVKIGLFLLVFALEIPPMVTFIKWRIGMPKGQTPSRIDDPAFLQRLCVLNAIQVILIGIIPIVASMMARGIGY